MSGITPGQTYSPAIATAGRKDAFHVPAILCRIARESPCILDAGDCVRIVNVCDATHEFKDDEAWDGIVDPFITESIRKGSGTLFWVFLRPERVRELRHVFDIVLPDVEPTEKPEPNEDYELGCRGCNS